MLLGDKIGQIDHSLIAFPRRGGRADEEDAILWHDGSQDFRQLFTHAAHVPALGTCRFLHEQAIHVLDYDHGRLEQPRHLQTGER